jgi:Pyridine nucleotide-disulphide oxidoreductase, dimerisation domain
VEADGDRILGFTAFGVGAGEIMSAVQIAMIAGLPYTALRDAVLTHPTLVEGLMPLFSSVSSAYKVAEGRLIAGKTGFSRSVGGAGGRASALELQAWPMT